MCDEYYADHEAYLREHGVLMFIGFPSAKDPSFGARFPGKSTCVIITEAQTEWADGAPRVSKMVLIGRALDREELERGFNACKAVGSGCGHSTHVGGRCCLMSTHAFVERQWRQTPSAQSQAMVLHAS